jgi:hypothetical protein
MLILHNLISGKKDYWIWIELQDGSIYDLHHIQKPFVGTEQAVNVYADKLVEQAAMQGLPLKEINIIPIKRAS